MLVVILVVCFCRFVYVWDAVTQRLEYKLPGHLGSVNDVHFHPNEPISELKERERERERERQRERETES